MVPASMQAPELPPTEQPLRFAPLLARIRTSQGIRAGVVLSIATLVFNGAAYLYNVVCIRYLGSRVYGDVAAMLALFALVSLPLASIQNLLAREVAQLSSVGAIGSLLRRSTGIAAAIGFGLVAVGLVLVHPIRDFLNVESTTTVLAGISAIFFAVVAVVLYGFLQGLLRFNALGVTYGLSGISRLVLVIPVLILGYGASGALFVNTFAAFLAVAIAAIALRKLWWPEEAETTARLDRRQAAVLLIGSLAFASLTNVDVLLAAYFLPDHLVGVYAAAALVGKMVLFLPAAVVMVLLPKAATRAAAGVTSRGIVLASVAVTLVVTLSATAVLAVVPESLLVWAFGGDFRESTALLGWFGLAMSACALLNVYLSVYFAERKARFPLLVLAAAVAQIVAVSVWHPNPRAIVLVTLTCVGAVLLIHEVSFPYALARVWGRRRQRDSVTPSDSPGVSRP
jgi:O-antigen/teichoic acid export membrane protein